MPGLSLHQYRAIQHQAAQWPWNRGSFDGDDQRWRMYCDPYFIRTMEEHGERLVQDMPDRYHFLVQTGVFPSLDHFLGVPGAFLGRVAVVVGRALTDLSLLLLSWVGPSSRRPAYAKARRFHQLMGAGSHLQFALLKRKFPRDLKQPSFARNQNLRDSWGPINAYSDKFVQAAWGLGQAQPEHESIAEDVSANLNCHHVSLYFTLHCLRTQYGGMDWLRGTPLNGLNRSHTVLDQDEARERALAFFDVMESLTVDLLETMQNLYSEFDAHTASWSRLYGGVETDDALQTRVLAYQDSYERIWSEFVRQVDSVNARVAELSR